MSSNPSSLPAVTHYDNTFTSPLRVGIVAARWHEDIVGELCRGAIEVLSDAGVSQDRIEVVRCPGTYEIPTVAQEMALRPDIDAVLTLGVVIRGDTPHFEYVAGPVAHWLQHVALSTRKPCIFSVLTVNTLEQALDRTGGAAGHKGKEGAEAMLDTLWAMKSISQKAAQGI